MKKLSIGALGAYAGTMGPRKPKKPKLNKYSQALYGKTAKSVKPRGY